MKLWFQRDDEAFLRAVRETVATEAKRLTLDTERLRAELAASTTQLVRIQNELTDAKKQNRTQTEADLVLVSIRIIANVLASKPRDETTEAAQRSYQQQLGMIGLQGNGIGAALAGLWSGIR